MVKWEEAIFLMRDYSLTGTSRAEMIYNKEKPIIVYEQMAESA